MHDRLFKILLVEGDENAFIELRDLLLDTGMEVELYWVATYEEALEALDRAEYDVYLVDDHLGDGAGLALLQDAANAASPSPVILLARQEDSSAGAEAVRMGAADYLVKGQIGPQLLERSIRYAVERAQLVEALHELATRDELTSLYNRREMARILTYEFDRSARYRGPLSLILISIDNFQQTNDVYGRPAGDIVLQWIAQLARDSIRATDRAARFSGEELAIILPETSGRAAYRVAERLRRKVVSQKAIVADANRNPIEISITVSLGIASLPVDADSEDGLVGAAYQALFEAKRRGSNRAVQYSEIANEREVNHLVR